MPRPYRFLTAANSSASTTAAAVAEPPTETVAVESDFVVILAALLCALICVVGLIAVARCAWLRRSPGDMANGRDSRQSSSANKGLKKKFVEGLPKFTYDGGDAPKLKSPECAICLADYVDGDEIRVLPQCGHGFHVGCIDTWLGSHSSCPSCRKILVIARCKKCGEFPTINSSDSGGIPTETELKSRQDCTTTTACSTTAPSSSSSSSTATYLP